MVHAYDARALIREKWCTVSYKAACETMNRLVCDYMFYMIMNFIFSCMLKRDCDSIKSYVDYNNTTIFIWYLYMLLSNNI